MGRYRRVDTRIWNDSKFRELKDDAKLLFFFIMTHQHMTSLGAMRGSKSGFASELGWSVKKFSAAFSPITESGMVEYEEKTSFIYLPNFLKYNGPENPNVVKSWGLVLEQIPECEGRQRMIRKTAEFMKALPDAFREALPKELREPLATPVPDPEPFPFPDPVPDSLSPEDLSNTEISTVRKQQNGNGRTNGHEKDFQKFWGPVEGHLRNQVVEDVFQTYYAGCRILQMSSQHVLLAVPRALLERNGNADATAKLLTNTIQQSKTGLLRDRELKIVSIEDVIQEGLL